MTPLPLLALVAFAFFLVAGSADGAWRWPVPGDVRADFSYSARAPFEAGQRRGVDVAARPGAVVVSACSGHVTHAGPVPKRGLGVTVRCGRLVATHLGLGRALVPRGTRVRAGRAIGQAGAAGVVRLGARVAGQAFQYVDPLSLLDDGPAPRFGPGPLGAAPRDRARRYVPFRALRRRTRSPRPAPAATGAPIAAWAGLALLAFALPAGGFVRRRHRATHAMRRRPAVTDVTE